MSVMGMGATGHTGPSAPTAPAVPPDGEQQPRVRELAREAAVVMGFSAGVSIGVAVLLLLAYGLGR